MSKIPEVAAIEVTAKEGIITIEQTKAWNTTSISFPVEFLGLFRSALDEALEEELAAAVERSPS